MSLYTALSTSVYLLANMACFGGTKRARSFSIKLSASLATLHTHPHAQGGSGRLGSRRLSRMRAWAQEAGSSIQRHYHILPRPHLRFAILPDTCSAVVYAASQIKICAVRT